MATVVSPSKPAAREGDPTSHPGLILKGSVTVLIEGKGAARVGDPHGCKKHVTGVMSSGSATVLIEGKPACKVGDISSCSSLVAVGAFTVLVGV